MEKFDTITSIMIPLPNNDVDTDQIIPATYLKVTDKKGLGTGLFAGWRYLPDGEINPDFPINQDRYQDAEILLVGDNFGCGSSREHAPWALSQWGIRAVISTSFADIFYNNSLKNGLLPIEVSTSVHQQLFELIDNDPFVKTTVNLPQQKLTTPEGINASFPIDPFNKKCLIDGIDTLGYLLSHQEQVLAFEDKRSERNFYKVDTRVQSGT